MTPDALIKLCRKIESALGHPAAHRRDMSRTIDIDIILYDELILYTDELTIPHPRALRRDFVLVPLSEIAGDWLFPETDLSVKECLELLKKSNKVRINQLVVSSQ